VNTANDSRHYLEATGALKPPPVMALPPGEQDCHNLRAL